jgi:hypothetical protein
MLLLILLLIPGSSAEKTKWVKAFTTAVGVSVDGVGGHKRAAEFERDARKVHIATSTTYVLEAEEEEWGRRMDSLVQPEGGAKGLVPVEQRARASTSERAQFVSEMQEGLRSREGTAEESEREGEAAAPGGASEGAEDEGGRPSLPISELLLSGPPHVSGSPAAALSPPVTPGCPSPPSAALPTPGVATYRLLDKVEINVRAGPSHASEPTGGKIARGSTFEVLESLVVASGRHDGGDQTFLKLGGEHTGGWLFLYHPSKGHALAEIVEEPKRDNDSFLTRAFRRSSGFF